MRIRLHIAQLWIPVTCSAVLVIGMGYSSAGRSQDLVAPSSLVSGGNELVVPLFKSRVLRLDAPAARVSVGNPDIADILILRATQLYVLGRDLGTTNVLLWDDADRLIGTVNIAVTHDLDNLKAKLFELMPNETIQVYATQRSIVLAGEVSSPAAMNAALRIADTYLAQVGTATEASQFEQESQSRREDAAVGEVINLMQVGGVQQVMLEVKVAEINRTELRGLNAQWNGITTNGEWTGGGVNGGAQFPDALFQSQSIVDPLTGNTFQTGERIPVPGFGGSAPFGPVIDEFAPLDMQIQNQGLFASFLSADKLFNLALDVAKTNNLAKILAEPTLTTLTGQEANFLAGGEIGYTIPQQNGTSSVEFRPFGVNVTFLPVVLGSGLINLKLSVEVSEILSLSQEFGAAIPIALGTRRAQSVVELREGQTMGIAGLIDEQLREGVTKFPGLGSIPVLGALFRSQEYRNEETELVIMVTPRLAKPLAPDQIRLPTDNFTEPSDAAWYLLGKLEGRPPSSGSATTSTSANASPDDAAVASAGSDSAFGHQVN